MEKPKKKKLTKIIKQKEVDRYYLITEDEEGQEIAFEVDNPNK